MSAPSRRCFYEVLGVPRHAQTQEIKIAYRRLALRYHPDKNQGNPSAKELFQEIQAAYEALSEEDKREKYDNTTGSVRSNRSKRQWREPCYGPCNPYPQDPPFWSVELRAMTVQKCARITKIQHLERQIRNLVINLNDLVDAENTAVNREKKSQAWLSFLNTRASKANAQRHRDFLAKSASIHTQLNRVKHELRTSHEEHRKRLEEDNRRKTWWARERVRRVEEENRRAATTAAEAARRRAGLAREDEKRDAEKARAAENERWQAQEEAVRAARAAKVEEETRRRAEREREDPVAVERRRRDAEEWLAREREEIWGSEIGGEGARYMEY